MSASQNLFDLIKSLTPAEKRYFKVFAKRHVKGDVNNYVLLFNAIDKQKIYDESKLLKKFQSKGFFRHFSSEKNYLYKLILKSMNAYDLDKSVEANIREQIGFISFFRKKRLYQQALKQLDKTKKLAIKHELYFYFPYILYLEACLINSSQQVQNQKRLKINQIEMERAFQKLDKFYRYSNLFDDVFWKNNRHLGAATKSQIAFFNETLQHKLVQEITPPLDFRTQKLYYQILQICYLQTHQIEKSYECSLKVVELYELQPHFLKNELDNYISMLGNIIVSCYLLGKFQKMYQIIQKLRAVPTQNLNQEITVFEASYNAEIAYYQVRKEFENVQKLLIVIEEKLQLYKNKILQPALLLWYYNLSGLYFTLKNYPKSLDCINVFFDLYMSGIREDVYNKAIYLNLLIHWQLNNHRLLESLIRSSEHYVRQKKRIYSLELPILSFFKKLLNIPPKTQLSVFQELYGKLENLRDEIEKSFWNRIGLTAWLKAQLNIDEK